MTKMKKTIGIGAAVLLVGVLSISAFALTPEQQTKLDAKKEVIAQRVEEGKITQETADEVIAKITENMENCDGTGNAAIGKEYGIGFGNGNGNGSCDGTGNQNAGNGAARGRGGAGRGQGGMGLRDGSCNTAE